MDRYELTSDPCDRRMMRFTNALQCFACVWDIPVTVCCKICCFSCLSENSDLFHLTTCIADSLFCMTIGCMIAQLNYELEYQKFTNPNKPFRGNAVSFVQLRREAAVELRREARNVKKRVGPDYSNITLDNNGNH